MTTPSDGPQVVAAPYATEPSMRSVHVTGVGRNSWTDLPTPDVGENDVLLRIRACGICGSDASYTDHGGIPPREGRTPLGHEAAGEVVEIGSNVTAEIAVGDHVVIDVKLNDGLLGGGGAQGGLTPYVVVRDMVLDKHIRVIPKEIPWPVAALNEPMAVALHGVNRSGAKAGDKAVVFGAGAIGLGSVLSLREKGVEHIVVVTRGGPRMQKALEIGADAVIDATKEDVVTRLTELHGQATDALGFSVRAGTDVYIDAAGTPEVIETAMAAAKMRAVITIVGVHHAPVPIDFARILLQELDFRVSMGYPEEIFQVTDSIIAKPEKYALIVSHTFPFDEALEALELARTPGTAIKVVVTLD
ncbi:zinc-dependent alcohol dehydrogenase [Streptomyces sp. JW3]|uniref:zinc-dependent alcohol dehydrogenase n=1 Tax=Streptomyces sp. JW3 TaxID=3456955 RepID=UPI003FA4D12E